MTVQMNNSAYTSPHWPSSHSYPHFGKKLNGLGFILTGAVFAATNLAGALPALSATRADADRFTLSGQVAANPPRTPETYKDECLEDFSGAIGSDGSCIHDVYETPEDHGIDRRDVDRDGNGEVDAIDLRNQGADPEDPSYPNSVNDSDFAPIPPQERTW